MNNSTINYDELLEFALTLAVRVQQSGAETYRIEETITRLLNAYGLEANASVIPNCITVSCKTPDGKNLSTLRRINNCETQIDAIEQYSALSRRLCSEKPPIDEAWKMLNATTASIRHYKPWIIFLGYFLVAFGFAFFFKGTLADALVAGVCGLATGFSLKLMSNLHANPFFSTLVSGFILSFFAHCFVRLGLCDNVDAVSIGALMILVPGFLFTNSLRDIIYGDTMSGVNRLVQVLIIAVALVVGTGAAVSFSELLFGAYENASNLINYSLPIQCLVGMIGTLGFCLWFNIHDSGILLCLLGSIISWLVYSVGEYLNLNIYGCYFISSAVVALYAEVMARLRKYPATGYLLASLVPLIPGAGVYYTMSAVAQNDMATFSRKGVESAAIAGSIAIGILLVSSSFRMISVYKQRKKEKVKVNKN